MGRANTRSRRSFLRVAAGIGAAGIAGCQGGPRGTNEQVTPAPVPAVDRTTIPLPPSTLEVRHGVLDRPTGAAMADLRRRFDRRHRPVTVVDRTTDDERRPTPSGDGDAIVGFGPLGAALRPQAPALLDLSDLWLEQLVTNSGPSNACLLSQRLVAVPQLLHRLNCLYYDPSLVEESGVDPADYDSLPAFVADLDRLPDGIVVPFARPMRTPTESLALWEVLLSGTVQHSAAYTQLVSGTVADHRDRLRAATAAFETVRSGLEPAARQRDPAALLDGIVDGDVGFVAAPSWAARHLRDREGTTYGSDWTASPVPGTEGRFPFTGSGLYVYAASDERLVGRAFLRFATSIGPQRRFNRLAGSIVPQSNADSVSEDRHPFYREQWADYYSSQMQPLSIAYGLAVRPSVRRDVEKALVALVNHDDVDRATDGIQTALSRASVL